MGNENFELSTETSVRESVVEKVVASSQGKQKTFYSVNEERTGSGDNILDDREDLKGIRCTTEVTIDLTEKQAQS